MKRILVLWLLLPLACGAQNGRDSLLLNERTMDRPITLHGGQMRFTGNYLLGINNKRYDDNGNAQDLSKEGLTNLSNGLSLEIKYGFTDFLQVTAIVNHQSYAERSRTTYIILIDEPSVDVNSMTITKGWADVFLAVDFRAPFKTRKLDWLLSAGGTLPSARVGQDQPSHTAVNEQGVNIITYQYNRNLGNGSPALHVGSLFKYRLKNTAFSVQALYKKVFTESGAAGWNYELIGNTFSYQNVPYDFQSSDELFFSLEGEYQLYPYFDLLASINYSSASGGWTEEPGMRVANPNSYLMSFAPGFEILITPKIWLRQRVLFAMAGKNQLATLSFSTTLNYNLFPFNK